MKWARENQSVNDFKKKKKNAKDLQNVFTFWILIVEAANDGIRILRHRARAWRKKWRFCRFGVVYNATFGLKK